MREWRARAGGWVRASTPGFPVPHHLWSAHALHVVTVILPLCECLYTSIVIASPSCKRVVCTASALTDCSFSDLSARRSDADRRPSAKLHRSRLRGGGVGFTPQCFGIATVCLGYVTGASESGHCCLSCDAPMRDHRCRPTGNELSTPPEVTGLIEPGCMSKQCKHCFGVSTPSS